MSEDTTEATKAPTIQQHAADLEQWLKARNLAIAVVAVGKRTGATMPIADFMPDTHEATFALTEVRP